MQLTTKAGLYLIVLASGALQAWGPPMNGALRAAVLNPWLASIISFVPIVAVLLIFLFCMPTPLPSLEGLGQMPWWAPLGGLVGAFAVVAGLFLVHVLGAGPLAGLTITANILMTLLLDHFGMFGLDPHPLNLWRVIGGLLMVGGITLVCRF